jgi:hypothetical protein
MLDLRLGLWPQLHIVSGFQPTFRRTSTLSLIVERPNSYVIELSLLAGLASPFAIRGDGAAANFSAARAIAAVSP